MKTATLEIKDGRVCLMVKEERDGKTLVNGTGIGGKLGDDLKKLLELFWERMDEDFRIAKASEPKTFF